MLAARGKLRTTSLDEAGCECATFPQGRRCLARAYPEERDPVDRNLLVHIHVVAHGLLADDVRGRATQDATVGRRQAQGQERQSGNREKAQEAPRGLLHRGLFNQALKVLVLVYLHVSVDRRHGWGQRSMTRFTKPQ